MRIHPHDAFSARERLIGLITGPNRPQLISVNASQCSLSIEVPGRGNGGVQIRGTGITPTDAVEAGDQEVDRGLCRQHPSPHPTLPPLEGQGTEGMAAGTMGRERLHAFSGGASIGGPAGGNQPDVGVRWSVAINDPGILRGLWSRSILFVRRRIRDGRVRFTTRHAAKSFTTAVFFGDTTTHQGYQDRRSVPKFDHPGDWLTPAVRRAIKLTPRKPAVQTSETRFPVTGNTTASGDQPRPIAGRYRLDAGASPPGGGAR